MFRRVYKIFYFQVFYYIIDAPKEVVIESINHLFMERSHLFKSPNLSGKFVDFPETFYMTQKWWFANIRNFESEPAILKGVITEVNSIQTKIEIAVRPNSIFLILFLFFLPYGGYFLYNALITKEFNPLYVGLWTLLFVLPLLCIVAKFCSKRLRKTFEKYMNLSPADEVVLPATSTSV